MVLKLPSRSSKRAAEMGAGLIPACDAVGIVMLGERKSPVFKGFDAGDGSWLLARFRQFDQKQAIFA